MLRQQLHNIGMKSNLTFGVVQRVDIGVVLDQTPYNGVSPLLSQTFAFAPRSSSIRVVAACL
jgi:hypothetical protein